MSTPTKVAEIMEAMEHIRRGTTEEFTATQAERAISLLADLDGGGGAVGIINRCGLTLAEIYTSAHPSPTAADAPPEADSRKPRCTFCGVRVQKEGHHCFDCAMDEGDTHDRSAD